MYSHNRNKHSRRDYYDEGHSRQSSPPPRSSSHRDGSISTIVAEHYNSINNRDVKERRKSKIYHMRSFNNWIKSVIIRKLFRPVVRAFTHCFDCLGDTIARLRAEDSKKEDLVVLDLCSGKGGDLIKFQKSRITHLVCAGNVIALSEDENCRQTDKIMLLFCRYLGYLTGQLQRSLSKHEQRIYLWIHLHGLFSKFDTRTSLQRNDSIRSD